MTKRVHFHSELLNKESSKARLVRAVIHQVAVAGVDRLSARAIIHGAHVSRTTLYQYFGGVTGVLAELWAAEGAEWLETLSQSAE